MPDSSVNPAVPGVAIVSTGRCGSTLLSKLLGKHKDVLSLSEFWPNRVNLPELFSTSTFTGPAYWELLSVPMAQDIFKIALSGKLSQVPSRSLHETNYMRRIALPSLVDDYDTLFDQIGAYVCQRPASTASEHIQGMFSFIANTLGRQVWAERTGASIEYLPLWRKMWPNLKMVHMYRDGRDVALSMSKHPAFKLMILRAEQNPESSWLRIRPLDAEKLDLEQFYARKIPLSAYGRLWNRMVCEGLEDLRQLPTQQQYWLRYEDLMADPVTELTKLLAFIHPELDAGAWAQDCSSTMRSARNNWRELAPDVLAELEQSCEQGLQALGYEKAGGR